MNRKITSIDLNVWYAQTNNVLKCSCWEIFDDIFFYLSAKKKEINEQEVEVLLVQKQIQSYDMPYQKVLKFQTSSINICWEIFGKNLFENLSQN